MLWGCADCLSGYKGAELVRRVRAGILSGVAPTGLAST